MNCLRTTAYSAVQQNDVYSATTEPVQESLSPTQAVFDKILGGRFNDKPKWVFTTMVCGLFAITLGSLLVALDPYEFIFRQKVIFSPGTDTYLMWEKPEVELYLKVYLFNVTNKDEYLSGKDTKLRFQETGPYVYRELMSHENATFNENGTVSSIPTHPLIYVPEMSNGSEDEILTLPNIALLSFAHVMRDASLFSRMGVNMLIKNTNTQPLVEMTAKEFMFGYSSALVSLGNRLLPSWIHFDKLGLIDRMYDFNGDTETTFTGTTDLHRAGLIDKYNGLTYLPHWPAPCNNITLASDGTKFPSRIMKGEELLFFRKSICRSMPMVRKNETEIRGIKGAQYVFKEGIMDNGFVHTENKCFCKNGECLPSGILDVSDCYYGFPIALSYPHFLETDEDVLHAVEGLNPKRQRHQTLMIINEESGLPLEVAVRMQINMALGDLSKMANSKKFSNMVLPMLWLEIVMPGLPDSMNMKFYFYLTLGPILITVCTYLLLICGVAFILLSLASALLIPRMGLISSNRGPPSGDSEWRNHNIPVGKKRVPTQPPTNNNKEMDMYYCSLLAVPNDES